MEEKDVGEIEEARLTIIGLRDICIYIENGKIKNISREVFCVFAAILKEVLRLLEEYEERIKR